MLITITTLVIALIVILWLKGKSKTRRVKDRKPIWSIGYALYFLTDIFTRGHNYGEALEYIITASRKGLPSLADATGQHLIVGLKAYANAQGELRKLNDPLVIQALSEAVAVEARTALQMAISRLNIEHFIKSSDPEIRNSDLKNTSEEILQSIQKNPLKEDGQHTIYRLVEHFLMRSFERHHGQEFYIFASVASQKLVDDSG